MQKIEVRFRYDPKLHSFVTADTLKKGDFIIAETALGQAFGVVENVQDDKGENLQKITRKATESDILQNSRNADKEKFAYNETRKLVEKMKLDMNIVNAEYSFDGGKVLIDFISENRVDFRELVKELASLLHTRIELKQIGVRDQAKMVGGIGICGRVCCCSAHLKDFEKVSIKMAKSQDLALNPTKISGACGRLMCCLAYEDPVYTELQATTPRVGNEVKTPDGVGNVVYRNLLKQTLSVRLETSDGTSHVKDFDVKDVTVLGRQNYENKNFKKKNNDKKDEN